MKQNGVLCYPGPALLFSIFRFRARKVTGTFEKRAPDRVRGPRFTLPSNRVKFLCGPLKEWKKITPSGQKIESLYCDSWISIHFIFAFSLCYCGCDDRVLNSY